MAFTAGRYLRATGTGTNVQDVVLATSWGELVGSVTGAHVPDAAAATAAALTDSTGGTASQTLNRYVRQAGIHAWAGGAATADSITVAGIAATDIVLVNLVAQGASSPTSVIGVIDVGGGQIDLVLDLNGEDGVTKVAYLVIQSATGRDVDHNVASLADEVNKLITDVASARVAINLILSRLEALTILAAV